MRRPVHIVANLMSLAVKVDTAKVLIVVNVVLWPPQLDFRVMKRTEDEARVHEHATIAPETLN